MRQRAGTRDHGRPRVWCQKPRAAVDLVFLWLSRRLAGRVARGNLTPGSHRSVRKPLGLYGSCRPGHQAEGTHFQCANMPGYRSVISCSLRWAGFDPRSRLYLLRIQRTR